MSTRRARGRAAVESDAGAEHPPPPEDPPREEDGGDNETHRRTEDSEDTGRDAGGGGGVEADATNNQEAVRAAVLKALSDPAVIRQLAVAISSLSSSSIEASATAHDGKTLYLRLIALRHYGLVKWREPFCYFLSLFSCMQGCPRWVKCRRLERSPLWASQPLVQERIRYPLPPSLHLGLAP